MSHPLSEEQAFIVDSISDGQHVICDAVAGSGKTTTVLSIANRHPAKQILQITYNSQLKLEVRQKAKEFPNMEVHSYHSFAVQYYSKKACIDEGIKDLLTMDTPLVKTIRHFDLLVLDELQDMTPLLFRLVKKILRDLQKPIQMLLLGDKDQLLYDFKEADARYLTLADRVWNLDPQHVTRAPLHTSFRVTRPIAWFLNHMMLGRPHLVSTKEGPRVQWFKGNPFTAAPYLFTHLFSKFQPEDIFVLVYSLKTKAAAPFKTFENYLVEQNIPCFVPTDDDMKIDDKLVQGKVVFSTFHQAKGRERPVVILFGFDNSLFKYYLKETSDTQCPSVLYVAVTRASHSLFLIESDQNKPLPFLQDIKDPKEFKRHVHLVCSQVDAKEQEDEPPTTHSPLHYHVTDLITHLSNQTLSRLTPLVRALFTDISHNRVPIAIPSTAQMKTPAGRASKKHESVSDLNGLVIPTILEAHLRMQYQSRSKEASTLHYHVFRNLESINREQNVLVQFTKDLKQNCSSIEDYLKLGIAYMAIRDKLSHKVTQIYQYNWLTREMVQGCHANILQYIPLDCLRPEFTMAFEVTLPDPQTNRASTLGHWIAQFVDNKYAHVQISGVVDMISHSHLWELKCVDELKIEHFLQLILYAWLWRVTTQSSLGERTFELLNIRTGEAQRLAYEPELVRQVLEILLRRKLEKKEPPCTDDEFIERCN